LQTAANWSLNLSKTETIETRKKEFLL